MQQITIRSLKQPVRKGIDCDLEWFCGSLGLLGERDKNKTGLKIFRTILDGSQQAGNASIKEIAQHVAVSRTAAQHHLMHMIDTGLIIRAGKDVELRTPNLQKLVDELGLDIVRILKSVREIAVDIDKELQLEVRA